MKLTKEQLLEKIKPIIGDSTDDNVLSLLEDINDTFNSSDEDYKIKYEEEVKGRAEDNKNCHFGVEKQKCKYYKDFHPTFVHEKLRLKFPKSTHNFLNTYFYLFGCAES